MSNILRGLRRPLQNRPHWGALRLVAIAAIVAGLTADALAQDDSRSNSRFAPRNPPAGQNGSIDPTRAETIVLPWFSPGVMNLATESPQTSAVTQTSVIQLPAFSTAASNSAPAPGFTPNAGNPPPKRPPPKHKIPEIDPASAGNALALLIGGVFILTDRRKRYVCA